MSGIRPRAPLTLLSLLLGAVLWLAPAGVQAQLDGEWLFSSDPADFIGQGDNGAYYLGDEGEVVDGFSNTCHAISGEATNGDLSDSWNFNFEGIDGEVLVPGVYLGAERAGFQGAGKPGISISRNGRGCNEVSGRFTLDAVRCDQFGRLIEIDVSGIQQNCEPSGPFVACGGNGDPCLYGLSFEYTRNALGQLPLAPGNFVVTKDNWLLEYQTDGTLVREFGVLDDPQVERSENDAIAALAIDSTTQELYLFNGNGSPLLSRFEYDTGTWSHETADGWQGAPVSSTRAAVAISRNWVFVTDLRAFDDDGGTDPEGILRFDRSDDFAHERFLPTEPPLGEGYKDLTMSADGMLYALEDATTLHMIEPQSMTLVETTILSQGVSHVAVHSSGDVFGTASNLVYRFNPGGSVVDSLDTGQSLRDVAVSQSGDVVATTIDCDKVFVSDLSLNPGSLVTIELPGPSFCVIDVSYVGFVEPATDPFGFLFEDGFESGDTTSWSASVGGT